MEVLHTFGYMGPNRRCDWPVMEQHIRLAGHERAAIESGRGGLGADLEEALARVTGAGLGIAGDADSSQLDGKARYERLYAAAAAAVQRLGGHRVFEFDSVPGGEADVCQLYFEYDHYDAGLAAAALVRGCLEGLLEGASGSIEESCIDTLRQEFRAFLELARPLATPADTRALLEAARKLDIPFMRMDREPYEPVRGDFRLRANGLIRFGHGRGQHTVDGTFAVDVSQSLFGLIADRAALLGRLRSMGIPVPTGADEPRVGLSARKAERLARGYGWPVVVKPGLRRHGRAVHLAVDNPERLQRAAGDVLKICDRVLVEPRVPGTTYKLLVAGGELLAVIGPDPVPGEPPAVLDPIPAHASELAAKLFAGLPAGLMVITLVTPDIRLAPGAGNGAVVDVDLAPRLDRLLPADSPLLGKAAETFLGWLFPEPAGARIPIASITGTNGKTTTCTMVAAIADRAGRVTGVATSLGAFVGNRCISEEEEAYLQGHYRILDHPEVEIAVLETTATSAAVAGFGYDRCEVGACLNVTPDHLGVDRIFNLEQMATVKRSVIERASEMAVLNADDPRCLGMAGYLSARRICLVSLEKAPPELAGHLNGDSCCCVVESIGGKDWIVLHDRDRRIEVMALGTIPATLEGRAEHNVYNALHAVAIGHFLGFDGSVIRGALEDFGPSYDTIPGRLNFHSGLPFTVVMDFAHNPDGVARIGDFAGKLDVSGRRLVALACAASRGDEFIRQTGAAAAGHFDHYVCKNFGNLYDREPGEVPALLRDGLVDAGVEPERITLIEDEFAAVDAALAMGRPGDLVIILAGKRYREIWERIGAFATSGL